MTKQKCNVSECEGKPEYCYSHFHEYKNKADKRGVWIAIILLFFVGIALVLHYVFLNVDEDKFCENKIKENFPEFYNIEGKTNIYLSGDSCIIRYKQIQEKKSLQRDGLRYIQEEIKSDDVSNILEKKFELVEKGDIRYLEWDDFAGYGAIIGFFLLFFAGFLLKDDILKW